MSKSPTERRPRHEVDRVAEAVGARAIGALPGRRIAAQRDDVADPGVPVPARNRKDLLPRGADACQVWRRRQRRFAQDAHDDVVRALAGRAVRAVGDRHEARPKRCQALHGGPQRLLHGGIARWKELERHGYRPSQAGGLLEDGTVKPCRTRHPRPHAVRPPLRARRARRSQEATGRCPGPADAGACS